MSDPVVVIGGGLAGLAVAARLAKAGHQVELYERSETLGGTWAPYRLASGVKVDDAPAIIGFPAPWRDLFRKSGRPLEAELARMGYALEPAQPATMIFADQCRADAADRPRRSIRQSGCRVRQLGRRALAGLARPARRRVANPPRPRVRGGAARPTPAEQDRQAEPVRRPHDAGRPRDFHRS